MSSYIKILSDKLCTHINDKLIKSRGFPSAARTSMKADFCTSNIFRIYSLGSMEQPKSTDKCLHRKRKQKEINPVDATTSERKEIEEIVISEKDALIKIS